MGWGWKQQGLGVSRLCPRAYLGHLGLPTESTALNISCWLCAGCPGNLHFHYVLNSSHDLQQDKSAEATLLTAHAEGLSAERSLAERQAVFLLHDGKQTPKVQRELHVATSMKEALGTPLETGNKIQVNMSHKAVSLAISREVLTHEQHTETTGSFRSLQHSRSLRQRSPNIKEDFHSPSVGEKTTVCRSALPPKESGRSHS